MLWLVRMSCSAVLHCTVLGWALLFLRHGKSINGMASIASLDLQQYFKYDTMIRYNRRALWLDLDPTTANRCLQRLCYSSSSCIKGGEQSPKAGEDRQCWKSGSVCAGMTHVKRPQDATVFDLVAVQLRNKRSVRQQYWCDGTGT